MASKLYGAPIFCWSLDLLTCYAFKLSLMTKNFKKIKELDGGGKLLSDNEFAIIHVHTESLFMMYVVVKQVSLWLE